MLDVYREVYQDVLAVPVIRGAKTESERFAGALDTYCVEALMQDGKALQGATSHDLGQNFGKAFNVTFQNKSGEREFVWQTSWGASTRMIGALIMSHSDDDGLVLPPKLAPIHVLIVPIWKNETEKSGVLEAATKIAAELRDDGLSVQLDDRDELRPGAKYFEWERKGVPLRLEIGPRGVSEKSALGKLRLSELDEKGKAKKVKIPFDGLGVAVGKLLDGFQKTLFQRASERLKANTVALDSWQNFTDVFAGDASKFVLAHWDGTAETEKAIKDELKVTIRCLPVPGDGPAPEPGKCIKTGAERAARLVRKGILSRERVGISATAASRATRMLRQTRRVVLGGHRGRCAASLSPSSPPRRPLRLATRLSRHALGPGSGQRPHHSRSCRTSFRTCAR